MFESDKQGAELYMKENTEFKTLYQRHRELNKKVTDAELGILPIDDNTLASMKKEKLWTKERLIQLWDQREQTMN